MKNNNRTKVSKPLTLQHATNNRAASKSRLKEGPAPTKKKATPNKRPASSARIEGKRSPSVVSRPNAKAQISKSSSSHLGTSTSSRSTSSSSGLADTAMFSSNSLLKHPCKWEAVEIRYIDRDNRTRLKAAGSDDGGEVEQNRMSPRPPAAVASLAADDHCETEVGGKQQEPEVKKQTVVVEKLHVRNLLNTIREQCGDLNTSRLSEYRPARPNSISPKPKQTSGTHSNMPVDSYSENDADCSPPDSSLGCDSREGRSGRRGKPIQDCKNGYTSSGQFQKNGEEMENQIHRHHENHHRGCFLDEASVYRGNPNTADASTVSTSLSSYTSSHTRDQGTQLDSDPCTCSTGSCPSQRTLSSDMVDTIVICPKKQPIPCEKDHNPRVPVCPGPRRRLYHAEQLETRGTGNRQTSKQREGYYSETQGSKSFNNKYDPPVLSQEEIDCYKQIALRVLMDRKKLEQDHLRNKPGTVIRLHKNKNGATSDQQKMTTKAKTPQPTNKPNRFNSLSNNSLCRSRNRLKNVKPSEVATEEQPAEGSILSAARIKGQIEKHKRRMSQSPKPKDPLQTFRKRKVYPFSNGKYSQAYKNGKLASGSSQVSLGSSGKSNSGISKAGRREHNGSASSAQASTQPMSPLPWTLLNAMIKQGQKTKSGKSESIKHERNALNTKKHKLDKNILMYDEFHQIMLQTAKSLERSRTSTLRNLREKAPRLHAMKSREAASTDRPYPCLARSLESLSTKPIKSWKPAKSKQDKTVSAKTNCWMEPPRVTSTFISTFAKKKCASSQTSGIDQREQSAPRGPILQCVKQENSNTYFKGVKQQRRLQQQQQIAQQQQQSLERLSREQQVKNDTMKNSQLPVKQQQQAVSSVADLPTKESTLNKSPGEVINLGFNEMLRGILKSPTARATQALGSFHVNQTMNGENEPPNNTTTMTVDQILRCYQELFSGAKTSVTNENPQELNPPKQPEAKADKERQPFVKSSSSTNQARVPNSPAKAACPQKLMYSSAISTIHKPCQVDQSRHQTRSASVTSGDRKKLSGFRRQTQSSLNKINAPSSSRPSSPAHHSARARSRNDSLESQNSAERPKTTPIQQIQGNIKETEPDSIVTPKPSTCSKNSSEILDIAATIRNSNTFPNKQSGGDNCDCPKLSAQATGNTFSENSKNLTNLTGLKSITNKEIDPSVVEKDRLPQAEISSNDIKLEENSSKLDNAQESDVPFQNADNTQEMKKENPYLTVVPQESHTESNMKTLYLKFHHSQDQLSGQKLSGEFSEDSNDSKVFVSVSQPAIATNVDRLSDLGLTKPKTTKNLRVLSETTLQSAHIKKPPIPISRKTLLSGCTQHLNHFDDLSKRKVETEPLQNQPTSEGNQSKHSFSYDDAEPLTTSVMQQRRSGKETAPGKWENIKALEMRSQKYGLQDFDAAEFEQHSNKPYQCSFYAEVSNEPQTLETCPLYLKNGDLPTTLNSAKAGESLSDSGLWSRQRQLHDTWPSMFKDVQEMYLAPRSQPEKKQPNQESCGIGDGSPHADRNVSILPDASNVKFCPVQAKRVAETKLTQPTVPESLQNRYLNVDDDDEGQAQVSVIRSCGAVTRLASFSEGTNADEDSTPLTLRQKPPVSTVAKAPPPPLPKPRWKRIKKQRDVLESDSADESSQETTATTKVKGKSEAQLSRDSDKAASPGNISHSTCDENVVKQLQDRTVAKTCEMVLNQPQVTSDTVTTETTESKTLADSSEGSSHSSSQNDLVITRASPSSSQHSSWVLSSSWEEERKRKDKNSKSSSTSGTTSSAMNLIADRQERIVLGQKDTGEPFASRTGENRSMTDRDKWGHREPSSQEGSLTLVSEGTEKAKLSCYRLPYPPLDAGSSSPSAQGIRDLQVAFRWTQSCYCDTPLFGEGQQDSNGMLETNKASQFDDSKVTSNSLEDYSNKNTTSGGTDSSERNGIFFPYSQNCRLPDHETYAQDGHFVELKARPLASLEELRLSRVGRSIYAERRKICQGRQCGNSKGQFSGGDSRAHVLDDSQETCYTQTEETNHQPSISLGYISPQKAETRINPLVSTLPPSVLLRNTQLLDSQNPDTQTSSSSSSSCSRAYNNQVSSLHGNFLKSGLLKKYQQNISDSGTPTETDKCQQEPSNKRGSSFIPSNEGEGFSDKSMEKEVPCSVSVATKSPPVAVIESGEITQSKTLKEEKTDKKLHSGFSPFKNPALKTEHCQQPNRKGFPGPPLTLLSTTSGHFPALKKTQELQTGFEKPNSQKILPRGPNGEKFVTVLLNAAAQTSTTDLHSVHKTEETRYRLSNAAKVSSTTHKSFEDRSCAVQSQRAGPEFTTPIPMETDVSTRFESSPKRSLTRKCDALGYIERKVWENLELFLDSVKKEVNSGRKSANDKPTQSRKCSFSAPAHAVIFEDPAKVNFLENERNWPEESVDSVWRKGFFGLQKISTSPLIERTKGQVESNEMSPNISSRIKAYYPCDFVSSGMNYSSTEQNSRNRLNDESNCLTSPFLSPNLNSPQLVIREKQANVFSKLSPPKRSQISLKRSSSPPRELICSSRSTRQSPQLLSYRIDGSPSKYNANLLFPSRPPCATQNQSAALAGHPLTSGNPFCPPRFRLSSPEQKPLGGPSFATKANKVSSSCPSRPPRLSLFNSHRDKLNPMVIDTRLQVPPQASLPPVSTWAESVKDMSFRQPPRLVLTDEDINFLIKMSDKWEPPDKNKTNEILSMDFGDVCKCPTLKEGENLMVFSETTMVSPESLHEAVSGFSDVINEFREENKDVIERLTSPNAQFSSPSAAESHMPLISPEVLKHLKMSEALTRNLCKKYPVSSLPAACKILAGQGSNCDTKSESSTLSLDCSNCVSYSRYINPDEYVFCSKFCTTMRKDQTRLEQEVNSQPNEQNAKDNLESQGIPGNEGEKMSRPTFGKSLKSVTKNLLQSLLQTSMECGDQKTCSSTNVWDTINLLTSKMFELVANSKPFANKSARPPKRRIVIKRRGCVRMGKGLAHRSNKHVAKNHLTKSSTLQDGCYTEYQENTSGFNNSKNITLGDSCITKSLLGAQKNFIHQRISTSSHVKELPTMQAIYPAFKNAGTKNSVHANESKSSNNQNRKQKPSRKTEKKTKRDVPTGTDAKLIHEILSGRLALKTKKVKVDPGSALKVPEKWTRNGAFSDTTRRDLEKHKFSISKKGQAMRKNNFTQDDSTNEEITSDMDFTQSTLSFLKDSESNSSLNAKFVKGSRQGSVFELSLSSKDTLRDGFRIRQSDTKRRSPVTSCFSSNLSYLTSDHTEDESVSSLSFTETLSNPIHAGKHSYTCRRSLNNTRLCKEAINTTLSKGTIEDEDQTRKPDLSVTVACNNLNTKRKISHTQGCFGVCNIQNSKSVAGEPNVASELLFSNTQNSHNILSGLPRILPQIILEPLSADLYKDIRRLHISPRNNMHTDKGYTNQTESDMNRQILKVNRSPQASVGNCNRLSTLSDSKNSSCDQQLEEIPQVKTKGYRALEIMQGKSNDAPLTLDSPYIDSIEHLRGETEAGKDVFGVNLLLMAPADETQVFIGDILTGKNEEASYVSYNIVDGFHDKNRCVNEQESTHYPDEIDAEERMGEAYTFESFINGLDSPLPCATFCYPNNVIIYNEKCTTETGQFIHPNGNILFCSEKDLDVSSPERNTHPLVEEKDKAFVEIKELDEDGVHGIQGTAECSNFKDTKQKYRPYCPVETLSNTPHKNRKHLHMDAYHSNTAIPNNYRKKTSRKKSSSPSSYCRKGRRDSPKLHGARMKLLLASAKNTKSNAKVRKSASCESCVPVNKLQRRGHKGLVQGEQLPASVWLTESVDGLWPFPSSPITKPRRPGASLNSMEDFDVDTYDDLGSFITEMEDTSSSRTWDAHVEWETLCQGRYGQDCSMTFTRTSTDMISKSKLAQCCQPTPSSSSSIQLKPMVQVNTYVDNYTQVHKTLQEDPAPLRCQGEQTEFMGQMSDKSIQAEPDQGDSRGLDSALKFNTQKLKACRPSQSVAANTEGYSFTRLAQGAPPSDTFTHNIIQDLMKLSLTTFVESLLETKLKKDTNSVACQNEETPADRSGGGQRGSEGNASSKVVQTSSSIVAENPKTLDKETVLNSSQIKQSNMCEVSNTASSKEKLGFENALNTTPPLQALSKKWSKEKCCQKVSSPSAKEQGGITTLRDTEVDTDIKKSCTPDFQDLSSRKRSPLSVKESNQKFSILKTEGSLTPLNPKVNSMNHFIVDKRLEDNQLSTKTMLCPASNVDDLMTPTGQKFPSPVALENNPNTNSTADDTTHSTDHKVDMLVSLEKKNRKSPTLFIDSDKSEHHKCSLNSSKQPNSPEIETHKIESEVSLTNRKTDETTPPMKDSMCEVTTISSSSSSLVDYGGLKYVLSRESKALWKRLTILESSYENCDICKRQYKRTTGRSLSPQHMCPVKTYHSRPCRLHKSSKTSSRTQVAHAFKSTTGLERQFGKTVCGPCSKSSKPKCSRQLKLNNVDIDNAKEINSEGSSVLERTLETEGRNVTLSKQKDPCSTHLPTTNKDDQDSEKSPANRQTQIRLLNFPENIPHRTRLLLKRKMAQSPTEDGIPPSKKASQSSCHSTYPRETMDCPYYPRGKVIGGAYRRPGALRGGKTARMVQLFERSSSSSGKTPSYGSQSTRPWSPRSGSSGRSNNASCGYVYSNCSLRSGDVHGESKIDSVPPSRSLSNANVDCITPEPAAVGVTKNNMPPIHIFGSAGNYKPLYNLPLRHSVTTSNPGKLTLGRAPEPLSHKACFFFEKERDASDQVSPRSTVLLQSSCGTRGHASPTSRSEVPAVAEFPLRFQSSGGDRNKDMTNRDKRPTSRDGVDQEEIIVGDYQPQRQQSSPDADQCIRTLGNILCEMRNTFPEGKTHRQTTVSPRSGPPDLCRGGKPDLPRHSAHSLSPRRLRAHDESNSASLGSFAFEDIDRRVSGRRNKQLRRRFSPQAGKACTAEKVSEASIAESKTKILRPEIFCSSQRHQETEIKNFAPKISPVLNLIERRQINDDSCNCSPNSIEVKDPVYTVQSETDEVKIFNKSLELNPNANKDNTHTNKPCNKILAQKIGPVQMAASDRCATAKYRLNYYNTKEKTPDLASRDSLNATSIEATIPSKTVKCNEEASKFSKSLGVIKTSKFHHNGDTTHSFIHPRETSNQTDATEDKNIINKYLPRKEVRLAHSKLTDQIGHNHDSRAIGPDPSSPVFAVRDNLNNEIPSVVVKPPPGPSEVALYSLLAREKSPQPPPPADGNKTKGLKWLKINRSLASMLRNSKPCSSSAMDPGNIQQCHTASSETANIGQGKKCNINHSFTLSNEEFDSGSLVLEPKETKHSVIGRVGSLQRPLPPEQSSTHDQDKARKKFDLKNLLSFRKRSSSREKRKL
ncbi:hypothetical protein ElyMa_003803700 [Elysia marginata]|uniref:Uncharacterized protein n=1 Tax=Elysia marginata TaxID=1093978 RepID=A0AAV4FD18_9GAST|nr:hypothetical protein ElyMa_003803700 [Elysia marginata]